MSDKTVTTPPPPPLRLIDRMAEVLTECAQDLEAEVEAKYDGIMQYPASKRRYERDIEPVNKAKKILEEHRVSGI